MPRSLRLLPLLALPLAVACSTDTATLDFELKTSGGHILDDRAWAVGSTANLAIEGHMLGAASVDFESDGTIEEDPYAMPGGFSLPPLLPGMTEWRQTSGRVAAEGDFDIVVADGFGNEQLRVPSQAREVEGVALGVALDDCPEFADFVFDRDATPAVLEGSTVMFTPAPLDGDGNPLVGAVDVIWDGADDAWGGSWFLTTTVDTDLTLSLGTGDIEQTFEVRTVTEDELVALQVLGMPEKHGEENTHLLSAVATTADGTLVHGLRPEWSNGSARGSIHLHEGESVEACVGALCAVWGE